MCAACALALGRGAVGCCAKGAPWKPSSRTARARRDRRFIGSLPETDRTTGNGGEPPVRSGAALAWGHYFRAEGTKEGKNRTRFAVPRPCCADTAAKDAWKTEAMRAKVGKKG